MATGVAKLLLLLLQLVLLLMIMMMMTMLVWSIEQLYNVCVCTLLLNRTAPLSPHGLYVQHLTELELRAELARHCPDLRASVSRVPNCVHQHLSQQLLTALLLCEACCCRVAVCARCCRVTYCNEGPHSAAVHAQHRAHRTCVSVCCTAARTVCDHCSATVSLCVTQCISERH
jgi:hypothetical protein